MRTACRIWFFALLPLLPAAQVAFARQAPDPLEVYDLIRTNLAGITDAQLQTAEVEGLVKELAPRVWLVGDAAEKSAPPAKPAIAKASAFDGPVGYLRLGGLTAESPAAVKSAFAELATTNRLKGLVLDLRFADGEDYAAAAATADLFLTKEQPLLDWGTGSAAATEKTNALALPVVVLVNRQTTAAAEALAAMLREIGVALVLGTNTAGRAMIAEDFPLKNGQHLKIARTGIKLGNGAELTASGIRPDIEVAVSPADEQAYWADPFRRLNPGTNLVSATAAGTNTVAGTTNRPVRRRINEAELVRTRREGGDLDSDTNSNAGVRPEPEVPVVRDPVLGRALDLIKGLALVRQLRGR